MSSSTGTRKRRTSDDRIDDAIKEGNRGYIHKAKRFTEQASQVTGSGPGASFGSNTPGPGSVQTSGDTMLGSIAYNPVAVLISDGRINIESDQSGASKSSSYVLVTGQGSPDDLLFIDGADKNGQILFLQGTETQIITLKHAKLVTISNISGLGTVTVVTSTNHNLVTGDVVNILTTTNFNVSNVTITVTNPTTFTYSATGNATPETAGLVQNGNIVTDDGQDVTLDATIASNGVPVAGLIFDPTVEGFGAWRVLFVSSGGGGGLSEPVILTINTITPQTLPTTSVINWSNNPNQITLDRDVEFSFSNLPASGRYEGVLVIIDVDGTGGYATPVWPGAVTNPPIVSTVANTRTSVMLYTINGGTVVTHATSVGSSSGGGSVSQWATFPAVTDVNFGTFDGLNIDRLRFATDSGIPVSAADPSIFLDSSSNMVHNVAGLKAISFKSNNVEIAKFIEAASTVYRLDMLAHSVHNAKDVVLDNTAGAVTFAGTAPALGFDSVTSRLILNMAAGANLFITNNNVIGSTQMNNNSITSNIVNASDVLQLGVDVTVPTVVGEFRNNGTDVTVFSGGSVINFSSLGGVFSDSVFRIQDNADATKQLAFEVSAITTATTRTITMPNADTALVLDTLGNLGTTAINTSLLFAATGNTMGTDSIPLNGLFVEEVRLQSGTIVTNKPMITSVGGSTLNLNVSLLNNIQMSAGGVSTHLFSPTSFTTDNIIVSKTLTINSNAVNPDANGQFTRNVSVVGLQADSFDVRRDSTVVTGEPAEMKIRKLANSINLGVEIGTLSFQTGISTAVTWGDVGVGTLVGSGTDASFLALRIRADNGLITAASFQGDDNNQRVQMLMGGTTQARIQPSFDRMGYFVTPQVTDFSLVLGTAGSIEIPRLSNNSPSLTDLNQAFGAFDGAFGYESVDERLYVRESSSRWVFFNTDGAVT